MPEIIRGGIKPLEMEAFKHKTKVLDRLQCYRPRRRADEEITLTAMVVLGIYPYILTMGYEGRNHKRLYTSMTWAEAVILNRMTQDELFDEVKRMQQERGIPYYEDPVKEAPVRRRRINRQKCAPLIVAYRDTGMTYAQIASILTISASMVGDIYRNEGQIGRG